MSDIDDMKKHSHRYGMLRRTIMNDTCKASIVTRGFSSIVDKHRDTGGKRSYRTLCGQITHFCV